MMSSCCFAERSMAVGSRNSRGRCTLPEMPSRLLEGWLRDASTGKEQRVGAIGSAAESLADGSAAAILDLVALAFGHPIATAADSVRDAVRVGDDTFAGRPSDLQTQ